MAAWRAGVAAYQAYRRGMAAAILAATRLAHGQQRCRGRLRHVCAANAQQNQAALRNKHGARASLLQRMLSRSSFLLPRARRRIFAAPLLPPRCCASPHAGAHAHARRRAAPAALAAGERRLDINRLAWRQCGDAQRVSGCVSGIAAARHGA